MKTKTMFNLRLVKLNCLFYRIDQKFRISMLIELITSNSNSLYH